MSRTRKQTFRAVLVALLVLLLLGGARWVFLHTIYEPPVEAPAPQAAAPVPRRRLGSAARRLPEAG